MSALIGALRVSLSAETAAFEAGMKRAQKAANGAVAGIRKSFGSLRGEMALLKSAAAGLVAGLSVGVFVAAGKAALEYAGSLGETAQQLGVTTRELQTFRYAASQNGASLEDADKALGKFAISLSKAQAGSAQTQKAFKAVGVELADIQTKSKSELLGQIADKMKETGGAANNAAAGVAIFGRGFLKIVPTLDQGSAGMNELARAADELGIVLSDSQIAKADETADKLDALQTVLKARIAGAVADNADSILQLADAIAQVANEAANGIGKLKKFYDEARIAKLEAENTLSRRFDVVLPLVGSQTRASNRASNDAKIAAIRRQQTEDRFSALFRGRPKTPRGTGTPDQFLASDGSKRSSRKPREDHSAERALSDAFRFDQDIRRVQQDVLNAMRDLSTDAVERYAISIQIKDLEKQAYEAELQYQVKLNELTNGQDGLTQAQAAQLKLQYDRVDQLERDKLIADENHRAFEESARLNDLDFELQRDRLESEQGIAETARDQRDVQLRILDLAYRQERAKLETILADEQSSDLAKEEARRRLANLNKTYGNDRQSVIQNTRGPMEQFTAQFGDISEELEQLKVNGIMGAVDALTELTNGWDAFRNAALSAIKQVIAELIRLQIMKMIANIAGAAAGGVGGGFSGGTAGLFGASASANLLPGGGLPPMGFATGGSMMLGGRSGLDKNMLSLNGLPIARVSRGEMMHIVPDGKGLGGGGGNHFSVTVNGAQSDAQARRTGMQIALSANQEISRARTKGLG
jgi:hypothetical protein